MEEKTKGIVIKSFDSGDRDKLITIFTPQGLICAKLRGVNSVASKMKFAKQPFCFAEFVFSTGKFPVVTSAFLIDSFYDLTKDYDKFDEAGKILRVARPLMKENQPNPQLFVLILKALKNLTYNNVQKNVVYAKFLLGLFYNQGYAFESEKCSSCGCALHESRYLNLSTGEVLCSFCKNQYCQKISFGINKVLKILQQTDFDSLHTIKFGNQVLLDTLHLLLQNYTNVVV